MCNAFGALVSEDGSTCFPITWKRANIRTQTDWQYNNNFQKIRRHVAVTICCCLIDHRPTKRSWGK